MTVFGLGPIGLEIGQALSRLGVKVFAVTRNKRLGGLSDPELQEFAVDTFSRQIELYQGTAEIRQLSGNEVLVGCADKQWPAETVLTAMGRKPNVRSLGLENLNVPLDQNGMPEYDRNTLKVIGAPVFFAGDVNRDTPLLHEATDEGRIAGINAVADEITGFQRRVPLEITFSSPNIVKVGKFHNTLIRGKTDFVTGKSDFKSNGRALMQHANEGKIHIYGDPETGKVLGAEMVAPQGEHLGQMLAWAISSGLTAEQILAMPFYHPSLEETLRDAFRQIVDTIDREEPDMETPGVEMYECKAVL